MVVHLPRPAALRYVRQCTLHPLSPLLRPLCHLPLPERPRCKSDSRLSTHRLFSTTTEKPTPTLVDHQDPSPTQAEHHAALLESALQAARTGQLPPTHRPFFPAAIDLVTFVRRCLLSTAAAEPDQDSTSQDSSKANAVVPSQSLVHSHCFRTAVESFINREDYFGASLLLEDWLNFISEQNPHHIQRKRRRESQGIESLTHHCVKALARHADTSQQEAEEAVLASCHQQAKRLLEAAIRAKVVWSSGTNQFAGILFSRVRDFDTTLLVLRRHLETIWWPLKLNKPDSSHPDKTFLLEQRSRRLKHATFTTAALMTSLIGDLHQQRKSIVMQTGQDMQNGNPMQNGNHMQTGNDHTGKYDPDRYERMCHFFHSLHRLSEYFVQGIFPPLSPKARANQIDPHSAILSEICRSRKTALQLFCVTGVSPPGNQTWRPLLSNCSRIWRYVTEAERNIFSLIEGLFQLKKGSPARLAGTTSPSVSHRPKNPRPTVFFSASVPNFLVCESLLLFSLRIAESVEMSTAIVNHVTNLEKTELKDWMASREAFSEHGEEASVEHGQEASSEHGEEASSEHGEEAPNDHGEEPLLSDFLSPVAADALRHINTTFLAAGARMRLPQVVKEAFERIFAEDLDPQKFTPRQDILGGTSARDITAQDLLALLKANLDRGDLHRAAVILHSLIANGLFVNFTEKRSFDELWAHRGDRDPAKVSEWASLGTKRICKCSTSSSDTGKVYDWAAFGTAKAVTKWSLFGMGCVAPLQAHDVVQLFLPSIWKEIQATIVGGMAFGGQSPLTEHASEEEAERDAAALNNAPLCRQILTMLVNTGNFNIADRVWCAILEFSSRSSVSKGKRIVSIPEATAAMVSLERQMTRVLPLPEEPRKDPAKARDLRTAEQCIGDVLAFRGKVREEYDRIMRHCVTDTSFDEYASNAREPTKPVRWNARFFRTVLDALVWPEATRAIDRQIDMDRGGPPKEYLAAKFLASDGTVAPFAQEKAARLDRFHKTCLGIIRDEESVAFLIRVLEDMMASGVRLPPTYTLTLLPYLGLQVQDGKIQASDGRGDLDQHPRWIGTRAWSLRPRQLFLLYNV